MPSSDPFLVARSKPHRYYSRRGIALAQGDSVQLIRKFPDSCIDLLATDPPYSSGGMTIGERAQSPRTKYCQDNNARGRPSFTGDNRDARSYAFWLTLWLSEGRRIMKPGGYVMVFSDWRQLPTMTDAIQAAGFTWRGIIVWDKGRGARAPHKGYCRHQCEYIVWGTNGPCAKAKHGGPFEGCITEPVRKTDKHHMTGKPTRVMRELVKVVPPRSIVFDPFCGSSTTLVAAALEGRRAIGIECEPAYLEDSAHRLANLRAA